MMEGCGDFDDGRLPDGTGLGGAEAPAPHAGRGPSDAIPSAAELIALRTRLETYEDCLRTVCHHLQLPQSESGPCDDSSRYDRELEAMDVSYRSTEAERAYAVSRYHRAEAALQPFADAAKGVGNGWDAERRASTINWDANGRLRVKHLRRAVQVLAIPRDSDGAATAAETACPAPAPNSAAKRGGEANRQGDRP